VGVLKVYEKYGEKVDRVVLPIVHTQPCRRKPPVTGKTLEPVTAGTQHRPPSWFTGVSMLWSSNLLDFSRLGPWPLLCRGSGAERGAQVPLHNGWLPEKARAGSS
jgi:hypothetical protein